MQEKNPLRKEVPSLLLRFEEKIWGMTLPQLLSDIGAGVCIFTVTSSLPLASRLVTSVLLAIPVLLLVHLKVQDQSLAHWIYLYARYLVIPRHATWQSLETQQAKRRKGQPAAVQAAWIQLDQLAGPVMGYSEPGGKKRGPRGRYWVVFEVEGRNVRYLPEQEQVRLFGYFEAFLVGLDFRLQFISLTEAVRAEDSPPYVAQKRMLALLKAVLPHIARLQQHSVDYQRAGLRNCTKTRYFVVASVSAREEARRQSTDGSRRGALALLWDLLTFKKLPEISRELALDQLRSRASALGKLCAQLEVRAWLLADTDLLQAFASCLALGAAVPSFRPQEEGEATAEGGAQGYKRRVTGLHGKFAYTSKSIPARFEAGAVPLADLLAPTSVTVLPDQVAIEACGQKRYQRYAAVTGYPPELPCGWVGDVVESGLPMITASQFDPIDTQFMLNTLEGQHVVLASQHYTNEQTKRITRATQSAEAQQVLRLKPLLAEHRAQMIATTMLIGVHASNQEHLDQRTKYLLAHLRRKQLRVRLVTRRHDEAWQASLPTCPPTVLDLARNLPSDATSTFLHFISSDVVGTKEGAFVGFVGSGMGKKPVYWNPWLLSNPHMAVIGRTGSGKSWLGKVIVVGLLGLGIADIVVLDKDDDYLRLHEELAGESQRYDLACGCPVNMFDIPYGPSDIDKADPQDLFSAFLDNSLMTALSLIIADAEKKVTNIEEAYLLQVARATYAAKGITSATIMSDPTTLLRPVPTLADFIATMRLTPTADEAMKQSLIEQLERAVYLFSGQTSVSIEKPLTIFSIRGLKSEWYPLATYVVQNFLTRHRALRRDERYLAYVVEEASYMLKHPAGRKFLENGSRGWRKLGIALFTFSQDPDEFLEEGRVVLNNAGTVLYLGMPQQAARKLGLPLELEHKVTTARPGQAVMRCGNEYAALTVASVKEWRALFTTHPEEQREFERREQARRQEQQAHANVHAYAS